MDTTTPQKLISDSLEILRRAAASLQGGGDATLLRGVEKAVGILAIIAPQPEINASENSDEESEPFVYTPEVLPLETLLEPINPDSPAGDNLRVSGEVNELLSLVVNRSQASDFRPQYRDLHQKAGNLLTKRGKDLGVAVRLVEAVITEEEHSGFAAVADGLLLINGLFSLFWDGLFPENSDGDCEARANELKKFEELITLRLNARYGKPHEFAPVFSDIREAEREAAVFKIIFEQLDLLDRTTYDKFDDQAPSLNELRSVLETYRRRVDARYEAFLQRKREEREEALRRKAEEMSSALEKLEQEERAEAPAEASATTECAEPKDVSDAGRRLCTCAKYLVVNAPKDPVGYMIHRSMRWFSRSFADDTTGPSGEERQKITGLFSAKKWNELLLAGEELFAGGGHRWLDLQRFQVAAAEHLGSEYMAVAASIGNATSRFAADNKKLFEERTDDGTPLVSEETAQWIRNEITEHRNNGNTAGSDASADNEFTKELQKADELANRGKQGAALNQLLSRQHKARSRRERFLWQLAIAEFCIRTNLTKVALPGIENMVETIDRLQLADWEDPDILLRVFKIGYDGYLSLGIDRAPEEKIDYFYQRICLYDPGHFVSSAEG